MWTTSQEAEGVRLILVKTELQVKQENFKIA